MERNDTAWEGRTATLVRPPIAKMVRLAAELAARGTDLIDLGQAIVGLPPPAAACDAVRAYLETSAPHAYSPDPGLPSLRAALAALLVERKGIAGAIADRIMVTCGANQAFANVLFTVTQPGDEVITFGPGYFDHGYTIRLAGCTEVEVPLREEPWGFRFDMDAVQRALGPRTRCVVLVSPGNPTGAVAPRAFVRELCALCRERDIWLISDETYDMLTFAPVEHWSPARVEDHDHVVVLGTFSKTFAMAGWRLGYFYAHEQVIEEAFKVQDALVVCAPVASQQAVLGALPHLEAYITSARRELQQRRAAMLESLAGCAVLAPIPPEGATFALARIRGDGDDVAFCQSLLERTGVVTVPGSAFGPRGSGKLRMSFGNQPVERIAEAGRRIQAMP